MQYGKLTVVTDSGEKVEITVADGEVSVLHQEAGDEHWQAAHKLTTSSARGVGDFMLTIGPMVSRAHPPGDNFSVSRTRRAEGR